MTEPVRAVFFDFGGTLFSNVQIPHVCTPALLGAAERLGLDGGLGKIGKPFIQATQAVNEAYLGKPFYLHRDLFVDTARELTQRVGREVDEAFNDWFYSAQRDLMVEGIVLRDDCQDTLAELRERGYLLSIVSNIDHDFLDPMVERLGLAPFFDELVSSETARSCKPDSGIFKVALERLGLTAGEVLFVGDSRIHDIQGASGVGMRSALLHEQGGVSHLDDIEFPVNPDYEIATLADLLAIDVLQRAEVK